MSAKLGLKLVIQTPTIWSIGVLSIFFFLLAIAVVINAFNLLCPSPFYILNVQQILQFQLLLGLGIVILFFKSLYYDGTQKYMHRPVTCLLTRYFVYLLASLLFCLILHNSLSYSFKNASQAEGIPLLNDFITKNEIINIDSIYANDKSTDTTNFTNATNGTLVTIFINTVYSYRMKKSATHNFTYDSANNGYSLVGASGPEIDTCIGILRRLNENFGEGKEYENAKAIPDEVGVSAYLQLYKKCVANPELQRNLRRVIRNSSKVANFEYLYFLYFQYMCIGLSLSSVLQVSNWFTLKELSYSCLLVFVTAILTFYFLVVIVQANTHVGSIDQIRKHPPTFFLILILCVELLLVCAFLFRKSDKRWKLASLVSPILMVVVLILENLADWWGNITKYKEPFSAYMMTHIFIVLPVCMVLSYNLFLQPYYKVSGSQEIAEKIKSFIRKNQLYMATMVLLGHLQKYTSHYIDKRRKITNKVGPQQKTNEVYISYAWDEDSKKVVEGFERAARKAGLKTVRDNAPYGKDIKDFMEGFSTAKCIVVIISEKYLKSYHCMYEMLEMKKNKDYPSHVFPIIMPDANIYGALQRTIYAEYWEDECRKINDTLKSLEDISLWPQLLGELKLYASIRNGIDGITDFFSRINSLTSEQHLNENFKTIIKALLACKCG